MIGFLDDLLLQTSSFNARWSAPGEFRLPACSYHATVGQVVSGGESPANWFFPRKVKGFLGSIASSVFLPARYCKVIPGKYCLKLLLTMQGTVKWFLESIACKLVLTLQGTVKWFLESIACKLVITMQGKVAPEKLRLQACSYLAR